MATTTEETFQHVTLKATNSEMPPLNNSVYSQVMPQNEPKFVRIIRNLEIRAGCVTPIKWYNLLVIGGTHLITVGWLVYNVWMWKWPKLITFIFMFILGRMAGFGVTGGAHRYWTHRAYKANVPLQLILVMCYSLAFQNTIPEWVLDHRVHHKFSETSADPHDARRGLFFSHMGWLLMRKHPHVIREGKKVDMSDILNDPIVRFHTKYFRPIVWTIAVVIPALIPPLLWGEDPGISFVIVVLLRYLLTLHATAAVNSFAHKYGNKPFNGDIKPSENWGVSFASMGEGWHNYHHTFPWDYKAAEFGQSMNTTTSILDLFARIGWAYDLKTASPSIVATMKDRQLEKAKNR